MTAAGKTRQGSERSIYGARARIGIIVPPTNTTNEPEFYRMAPAGVSVHSVRMKIHRDPTPEGYRDMLKDLTPAVRDLALERVDVIAYACTVSSISYPVEDLLQAIEAQAKTPAVSTASALLDSLRALKVRRIAMATPYSDDVNEHEKHFFEANGIEVVSMAGLGVPPGEFSRIAGFTPQDAYALARSVDRLEAEAILISCTDFATADILGPLEADTGKPAVTSNQATLWRCLRAAGISDRLTGFGRLLSAH
jgi:arylmalonate decarboxylase